MRSKQQPRPSYRWINKDENDPSDEPASDIPEGKENLLRFSSISTISSQSSQNALENISQQQKIAVKQVQSTSLANSKEHKHPHEPHDASSVKGSRPQSIAITLPECASTSIPSSSSSSSLVATSSFLSIAGGSSSTTTATTTPVKVTTTKTYISPIGTPTNKQFATTSLSVLTTGNTDRDSSCSSSVPGPGAYAKSIGSHNDDQEIESWQMDNNNKPIDSSLLTSNSQRESAEKHHPAAEIEHTGLVSPSEVPRTGTLSTFEVELKATNRTFAISRSPNDEKDVVATSTKLSSNNLIDSHDDVNSSSSSRSNNMNSTVLPIRLIPSHLGRDPSAERELASPRCQSRDSSSGGRCPSDDSNYSGNGSTSAPTPTPTSPVGITLPATLPPAAAAALLPPQSAAMAAYLNVAAAAAQQNRLLMSNPLAAAAGLVRAAHSPPNHSISSPGPDDTSILDFSTKRMRRDSDASSKHSDSDVVNLSKPENGPLDLSCGGRKRCSDPEAPSSAARKIPRPAVVSPWTTPMSPYFAAAVAAASLSPKNPLPVDWNGKSKMITTNDAAKALEKMSEMTRLGGSSTDSDIGIRPSNNQNTTSSTNSGRHSAWQSHWLNKGADAVKDVFKCVWCKQSFPTLATLTTHMKETQHCGVNVPPSGNMSTGSGGGSSGSQQSHQHHHQHHQSSNSSNNSSSKSDLNLLIKETMPLPRKLVRGQDVWLGKGAEQTRQILKCMWCGQSFRSLAEMTSHMQQTQHYTNIISQEQIISWKSSEDGKGGSSAGASGPGGGPVTNAGAGANSTVSAVLTCKVCDQAFSSLKDLSNHMVKNSHYKEHIMRSITESGGRRRQTREKRKKSLPVRKLLELERAQHEFKNGGEVKPMRPSDIAGTTRITCEKCGDKIETALFVEHIRQCVGGTIPNSPRNMLKSSLAANSIIPPDSLGPLTPNSRDERKSIGDESASPASNRHISPHTSDIASPTSKDALVSTPSSGVGEKMSSPSVLNAIEQLIEKSFDTRSRHSSSGFSTNSHTSAPLGSSILKRLGIDESVDYTKPLIDPQTMNLLRTYQQQQYSRRERSGSESSSVSDRGSSRLESLTPERKPDMSNHITPTQSPDKNAIDHHQMADHDDDDHTEKRLKVKKESTEDDETSDRDGQEDGKADLSKEAAEERDRYNEQEIDLSSKRQPRTPSSPATNSIYGNLGPPSVATSTPAASPCSDRSVTPRSTPTANSMNEKKLASGSLTALSSMFDNLNSSGSTGMNSSDGNSGHHSGKKGSSHPLAALQKLCDKTETPAPNSRSGSASALASNIPASGGTASGAILAFSWACNDAIMNSDSIIKCAFCDTPFCSKGAYRHHLSKVHFVKDDVIIDPIAIKNSGVGAGQSSAGSSGSHRSQHRDQRSSSQSPKNLSTTASGSGNLGGGGNTGSGSGSTGKSPSPSGGGAAGGNMGGQSSSSGSSSFEESPHSKFLKYTELAKQLSSKYV